MDTGFLQNMLLILLETGLVVNIFLIHIFPKEMITKLFPNFVRGFLNSQSSSSLEHASKTTDLDITLVKLSDDCYRIVNTIKLMLLIFRLVSIRKGIYQL